MSKYLAVILFLSISFELFSQQQGFGIIPDKKYLWFGHDDTSKIGETAKPIVQVPPLCGKKRRNLGHDLPLPFGAGLHTMYYTQEYKASDLKIVNDENDISARADTLYQNTTNSELKVTFRPDVWLLPFLNVYGIIGYTKGQTNPDLYVPYIVVENVPGVGEIVVDTSFVLQDKLLYHGPTYGGGATISTGYKSFFLFIDYHYSVTDPSDLDGKLHNHFFSPKIGVLLGKKQRKSKGAFWLGAMYISDNHTFKGEIDVKEISPILELIIGEKAYYSGNVTAIQPWNFIFGASWMINKHHYFVLEGGLFQRQQLTFVYAFRF